MVRVRKGISASLADITSPNLDKVKWPKDAEGLARELGPLCLGMDLAAVVGTAAAACSADALPLVEGGWRSSSLDSV